MQENEFEKQVKQKMDEFRLSPSEPVWPEITEELRDKRKRRLILIPLFAVLLVAGYFSWQSFFRDNKISSSANEISIKNKIDENKIPVNKNDDKTNTPSPELSRETKKDQPGSGNLKDPSSAVTHSDNTVKEEKNTSNKISNKESKNNPAIVQNNQHVTLVRIKKTENRVNADIQVKGNKEDKINYQDKKETNLPDTKNSSTSLAYQNNVSVEEEIIVNKMHPDKNPVIIDYRLPGNNLYTDSINATGLMTLQLPAFKNQGFTNTSGAIKFGITFSAGVSSRVNKPLQISSSEKSTLSAQYSGVNASFNNLGGGVSILPPSDVKPGTAFKAGIIAMKSVSKRFDFSAGLQYSYSSDHIRVGKSIGAPTLLSNSSRDVLAQAYYPNVQNANHTNKYHFIELPVSVYFNLNKNWKAPFVWNAGVSVSRLVSSDVLLYDVTWGGIYYQGNDDIRKTQVNLSTGFSLRFAGSNRWQWNIGPQVYMSATKLFNNDYDKNKHPVYGGLNVQVLLPAKKKHR